jgi:hypothetical protein
MVPQVRFLSKMKWIVCLIPAFLCIACLTDTIEGTAKIPGRYLDFSANNFESRGDTLVLKGVKFSGYVYHLYDSKDTAFLFSYLDGLSEGVQKKWYENKVLMEVRSYHRGKKNGRQITYWDSGRPKFTFMAVNDANEGEMKEWDDKGNLSHLGHYKNGQEEGEQKMWYSNGKIRSNYIIRNGRRYGLLGTKNCINVTDSLDIFADIKLPANGRK